MTDESEESNEPLGMIGEPPSARYPAVPKDPADHAVRVAREWRNVGEAYAKRRMEELGIPEDMIGEPDRKRDFRRIAFNPDEREGGNVGSGITINSGVLNPDLLEGKKGVRVWRRSRLRDRIDAIIAHEWEESKTLDHPQALKDAARTRLPVSEGARRILRAMAR